MIVASCVHPVAALSLTGPLASASGSLIASLLTGVVIWLRLLWIRAREGAECPLREGLLPQLAAMLLPIRCAQTKGLGRSLIDRAPTLLRAPPSSVLSRQDSTSVRPQCARAESAAIAMTMVDRDTPPPPPVRTALTPAQPLSGVSGLAGFPLSLRDR
jgi:hypothetical protein